MKILTSDNLKIINEVGRWKVISLNNLSRSLNWDRDYSTLCKRLKRLENAGYLKGFFERRKIKYFTLTEKGAEISIYPYSYDDGKESIIHDLICTNAILNLLRFNLFKSGSAMDFMDSSIAPDGVIHASRYGVDYIFTIELELHQKSKRRVVAKFAKYLDEKSFDHVLYITNKKSIFDAYRNILSSMNDKVRKKIALAWDQSLSITKHDYENTTYWINGKYRTFQEMFGESF